MNSDKYELTRENRHSSYQFYSYGAKGIIKKVIVFQKVDIKIYNLAFGDWNDLTKAIDDQIVSGNQDAQKILNTVAFAVCDFMKENPTAIVFAEGSTPSRTRLYQMNISAFLEEINEYFEVSGYVDGAWQSFRKGINYQSFLLTNRYLKHKFE